TYILFNLILSSLGTVAVKFSAVNFQRCFRIDIQRLISADSVDLHHKFSRPRIQIVADARQHRDKQQRENQEAWFVIPPQVCDKAISVFERRAAARAEV